MPFSQKQFLKGMTGRARTRVQEPTGPGLSEILRSQLPEDGGSAWINPVAAEVIQEMGSDSTGVDLEHAESEKIAEKPPQRDLVAVSAIVEEALGLNRKRIEGINVAVNVSKELQWPVEPLVAQGVLTSLISHAADVALEDAGVIVIRDRNGCLSLNFNGPADELLAVFGDSPGRLVDSMGRLLVKPGLVATWEAIVANHGTAAVERLKGWGTNVWFTFGEEGLPERLDG